MLAFVRASFWELPKRVCVRASPPRIYGRCGVEVVIELFASSALMKGGEWLRWHSGSWG